MKKSLTPLSNTKEKSFKKEKQNSIYKNAMILKELVSKSNESNKNNKNEKDDKREAQISNYGHYICLMDGFNSNCHNRIEVDFPSSADLSLTQNKGFTLFFWCLIRKASIGCHRFLIKKGNLNEDLTPSVGITPDGNNFFVKMNTSKGRTESLFSSKAVEYEKLYNITVTFEVDVNNDLTDVALYIDGLIDSQISLPGEPIHNQGHLAIGKPDDISHGFNGWIADVILIPKVLRDEEISDIGNQCIESLMSNKALKSYYIIEHKLEYDCLLEKYSQVTGVPYDIAKNMNVMNSEIREILKHYNIVVEEKIEEIREDITIEETKTNNLREFLGSETSILCISVKNLYTYSQFVYTILYLCATPSDEIEISRVFNVLRILEQSIHVNISVEDLKKLNKLLDANSNNTGDIMKIEQFFKILRLRLSRIFSDLSVAVYVNDKEKKGKGENNPIELHESLLLASQYFKHIDYDFQKDLAKSTFSIKSIYNRGKSARENADNERRDKDREKDDMVNQNYGSGDEYGSTKRIKEELEEDNDNLEGDGIGEKSWNPDATKDKPSSKKDKKENIGNVNENEKNQILEKKKDKDSNDEDPEYNNAFDDKVDEKIEEDQEKEKEIKQKNIESDITEKKESHESKEEKTFGGDKPEINDNKFQFNSEFEQTTKIISRGSGSNDTSNNIISNNNENNKEKSSEVVVENNKEREKDNTSNKLRSSNNNSDLSPKFPEDWNQGAFELVINRCYGCHNHKTTTKHCEYQFVDKFNEIADQVLLTFPNCKVFGNYDSLSYYGQFDVYLRGVGPNQDDSFRYFIFKLKDIKKFPSNTDILDSLVALSMLYGSSVNLEISQSSFMKEYKGLFKPSKFLHENPAELTPEAEEHRRQKEQEDIIREEKKNKKPDPGKTKYVCCNNACNVGVFTKSENNEKACTYHPGLFQFGSYHVSKLFYFYYFIIFIFQAYWPEVWTCCEKTWDEPGCTQGPHKPIKIEKKVYLCVNHGEPNPNTGRPDHACGAYYLESESSGCKIHPGFKNNGRFTCCGKEGGDGCQETSHKSATWPDEKAKLFFYPKILNNPGLRSYDKKTKSSNTNLIGNQICNSGLFKNIKPYPDPRTKHDILLRKREKEKTDLKYCMNWACGKLFKDIPEENKNKSCLCHPGKYDHGCTGIKLSNYTYEISLPWKERKSVLWEPHWTCCRKGWNEPGCRRMKHKGLFTEEVENAKLRPYKWPDVRAKLYFNKIVSDRWKETIKQYIYPSSVVKKILSTGSWSVSNLPDLCDKLKLYLLLINEKPDYHMKFNDVVTSSYSINYFLEKNGNINPTKFMKWWFEDYQDIMNELMKKD